MSRRRRALPPSSRPTTTNNTTQRQPLTLPSLTSTTRDTTMAKKLASPSFTIANIEELAKASGISADRFPETKEEADAVETVLAKELEKLSLNEQEKILFDIHGVVEAEPEDPQVVETKLQELEVELSKIEDKPAYELAHQRNPQYVTNPAFRLMFLRREHFDVENSAKLMVQHFEVKRKLFGHGDVLGREVLQSDLGEKDQIVLASGFLQILPERDAAGRTVLFMTSQQVSEFPADGWDVESDFRATWYICMKALLDEETQKRGIVWVVVNLNSFQVSAGHFHGMIETQSGIPHRIVGGHFCYENPALRPYVTGFQLFAGESNRNHLRSHCGSMGEINFELMTFGIPTEFSPVDSQGCCSTDLHRETLTRWRTQEQSVSTPSAKDQDNTQEAEEEEEEPYVVVPRRFDVLFGKTAMARGHTGTLRALHLVEMYYETYESVGKFEKTSVADRIIQIIYESGGRFLREDDEGFWRAVDDTEARKKVAHWFRHSRRKKVVATEDTNSLPTTASNNTEGTDSSPAAIKRRIETGSDVGENEENYIPHIPKRSSANSYV
eukprot:Nitzschia sp. Nitz4//scaffold83_size84149//25433//27196//NITZ4_005169-RA/size84149-snap-gene-0.131-mRNA-1//-1//CDS//3329558932//272//frame0